MKRSTILRSSAAGLGIAGLAAGSIVMFGTVATAAGGTEEPFVKRDDRSDHAIVVTLDDEDDDRAGKDTNTRTNANTRTNPNTRSKVTNSKSKSGTRTGIGTQTGTKSKASRDRDISRGTHTRDWTRDGGGKKKIDKSRNHTNDKSRNDTRG